MDDCLFCRIIDGTVPSTIVSETERVFAFRDIAPKAPVHVLIIPKEHYREAGEVAAADPELAGLLVAEAAKIAQAEGIASTGYRLMFNTGSDGGQEVFHAHLHLLGGKPLGPMLHG